jgi:cation:H+ antiporter
MPNSIYFYGLYLKLSLVISIAGFIICAALIIYAGSRLSIYGDMIAEKTGVGRSFTGLILLATVTSLPELITGISSVTWLDAPDLAAGNVFGSCLLNLFILALLDPLSKDQPISSRSGQGHILTAMVGIVLLSVAASSLIFRDIIPSIVHIGIYSFFLIIIYFVGIRLIFLYERRNISDAIDSINYSSLSLKEAILKYVFNAFLVIVAAIFLPVFGEELAEASGLTQSFFGTIFISATTVLPEVVVSVAAVRLGSINLAFGNLLGSNIFNIVILAADDIFYLKGPILNYVSSSHLISVFTCIIMTAFISAGIVFKVSRKKYFISLDSVALIVLYLAGMIMLYLYK